VASSLRGIGHGMFQYHRPWAGMNPSEELPLPEGRLPQDGTKKVEGNRRDEKNGKVDRLQGRVVVFTYVSVIGRQGPYVRR